VACLFRVDEAIQRFLSDDPRRIGGYPDAEQSAKYFQQAPVQQLRAALQHQAVVTYCGPPGSGKTFSLLVLGHLWESIRSTGFLFRPRHLAFYAPLQTLDIDAVEGQWESFRDYRCLWLLDDSHADGDLATEIAESFHREELKECGHRLVFAGWPQSERRPTVAAAVSAELVQSAFEFAGLEQPPPAVLNAVARPGVSLTRLLWVGKFSPDRLADIRFVRTGWASHLAGRLTTAQAADLRQFGWLQYLGLFVEPGLDSPRFPDLLAMREAGLLRGDKARFLLCNDDLALSLVLHDMYGPEGQWPNYVAWKARVGDRFVRLFEWLISEGQHSAVAAALLVLRARTVAALARWMGLTEAPAGRATLLDLLSAQAGFRSTMEAFVESGCSIPALGRALVALRAIKGWVETLAARAYSQHDTEIRAGLQKGDVASWLLSAAIYRIRADQGLRQLLASAAQHPCFGLNLSQCEASEAAGVLRALRDIEDVNQPFTELRRTIAQRLLPPSGVPRRFWRRLRKLGLSDPVAACELVQACAPDALAEALLQLPSRALALLHAVETNTTARTRIKGHLQVLLRNRAVKQSHVDNWPNLYSLRNLFRLCHHLGTPWLLDCDLVRAKTAEAVRSHDIQLSKAISRSLRYPGRTPREVRSLATTAASYLEQTLAEGMAPLADRLYCLALLDRRRAAVSARWLASKPGVWPVDTERLFWLLWNMFALLGSYGASQSPAEDAARNVTATWDNRRWCDQFGLPALALQGVAAALQRLPSWSPPMLDLHAILALRPRWVAPLVTCQLHAAAANRAWSGTEREDVLGWLVQSWVEPTPQQTTTWIRNPDFARRAVVRLLERTVAALSDGPFQSRLLLPLGEALASEKWDGFCDVAMSSRLRVVHSCAGVANARALLERQFDSWSQLAMKLPHDAAMDLQQTLANLMPGDPKSAALSRLLDELVASKRQ